MRTDYFLVWYPGWRLEIDYSALFPLLKIYVTRMWNMWVLLSFTGTLHLNLIPILIRMCVRRNSPDKQHSMNKARGFAVRPAARIIQSARRRRQRISQWDFCTRIKTHRTNDAPLWAFSMRTVLVFFRQPWSVICTGLLREKRLFLCEIHTRWLQKLLLKQRPLWRLSPPLPCNIACNGAQR